MNNSEVTNTFSNILISIMKLEDLVNRFDIIYMKMNDKNQFQMIEVKFYDTFKNCLSHKETLRTSFASLKKQLLQLSETPNSNIITDLFTASDASPAVQAAYLQRPTVKNVLKVQMDSAIFWKVIKQIKAGGSNITPDTIKSAVATVQAQYRLVQNKAVIDLSVYDAENYFNETRLDVIFDSINNTLANLNVDQLLDCLKNIVEIFQEYDLPIIQKIIKKIDDMMKLFGKLNETQNTPVVSSPLNTTQYQASFKEILKMFLNYSGKKHKTNVGKVTNTINAMTQTTIKHYNGITLTFTFVTRLLKLYMVTMLYDAQNPIITNLFNQQNMKQGYQYLKKMITVIPPQPPLAPQQPQHNDHVRLHLVRPSITQNDLYKIFSAPNKYRNCRNQILQNQANNLSQLGKELSEQALIPNITLNNLFAVPNCLGTLEEILSRAAPAAPPGDYILPYGESTGTIFTNAIFGKTIKDFREFMNYFILYQLHNYPPPAAPPAAPQGAEKDIYIICDPKVMEKVFGVKEYTPAAKSIYYLPYLNSVTLDVYVNVQDYDIYYDVANVKQDLFFDLIHNTIRLSPINPLPAPPGAPAAPVNILLDPTDNNFVKRIEKYYNRSLTNCPRGI